jgi:hypothetical protein
MSLKGNVCSLVVYHYKSNAILVLPINNFANNAILAAYQQQFELPESTGKKLTWRNLEGYPAQLRLTWRNLEGCPAQPGFTWRNLEGYPAQSGLTWRNLEGYPALT